MRDRRHCFSDPAAIKRRSRPGSKRPAARYRSPTAIALAKRSFNADTEHQRALFDIYPTLLRNRFVWPTLGNHETSQSTTATLFVGANLGDHDHKYSLGRHVYHPDSIGRCGYRSDCDR